MSAPGPSPRPPPEAPGAWSVDALTRHAPLVVSAPGESILVVHRLAVGGRSVVWRDAWIPHDESLERMLVVPPEAIVHPGMLQHTLLLHTRLETEGAKHGLEPLGVRLGQDPVTGVVTATVLPTIAAEAPTDPDTARNIVHTVIRYDRDLMAPRDAVVLEPAVGGAP